MADHISREAAIETVSKWLTGVFGIRFEDGTATIFKKLQALPAADVREVRRGKWITHPRETWIGVDINGNETQPRQYFAYECPFCGFTAGMSGKDYNFCPNCGADMREES